MRTDFLPAGVGFVLFDPHWEYTRNKTTKTRTFLTCDAPPRRYKCRWQTQRASPSPTHKRTEGRAPVWGSELTTEGATLQGGVRRVGAQPFCSDIWPCFKSSL